MRCIHTPNNLEVLLHYHVTPTKHPRFEAPAVEEAIEELYQEGLIVNDGKSYRSTAKGKFYIEHLLRQPYPVTVFSIPEVK